ncbi:hypothetical protein BKA62DRAFT_773380 [Auriculariales sp. MPI-PUGE-AT-0066]|nr:hypothetical protein BKA62DRAFT_773380 [Auriculariales sp. MPI-PUGE-AT-0066]
MDINDNTPQLTLMGVTYGLQALCLIVVGARLHTRLRITRQAGADDWLILAAAGASVGFTVFVGICVANGVGRHQILLSMDELSRISRAAWISAMMNIIGAMFVRTSILVFFLRLFPSYGVRLVAIVLAVLSTGYGIAAFFSVLLQCLPIGSPGPKCIDRALFYRSISIISMILDFAIILTPIPPLWNAMLPWRAKLSVILVFAVGLIPCIASVFRVILAVEGGDEDRNCEESIIRATRYAPRSDKSLNRSDSLAIQITWAAAELQMAIICASGNKAGSAGVFNIAITTSTTTFADQQNVSKVDRSDGEPEEDFLELK